MASEPKRYRFRSLVATGRGALGDIREEYLRGGGQSQGNEKLQVKPLSTDTPLGLANLTPPDDP